MLPRLTEADLSQCVLVARDLAQASKAKRRTARRTGIQGARIGSIHKCGKSINGANATFVSGGWACRSCHNAARVAYRRRVRAERGMVQI